MSAINIVYSIQIGVPAYTHISVLATIYLPLAIFLLMHIELQSDISSGTWQEIVTEKTSIIFGPNALFMNWYWHHFDPICLLFSTGFWFFIFNVSKTKTFKLCISVLLSYMPYTMWQLYDGQCSHFLDKSLVLIFVICCLIVLFTVYDFYSVHNINSPQFSMYV